MFKSTKKSIGRASYQASAISNYRTLVRLFGEGIGPSIDGKASMRWVVEDDEGNVFEIYDYKATSLYFPGYPTPDELKKEEQVDFSIGGKNHAAAKKLADYIRKHGYN